MRLKRVLSLKKILLCACLMCIVYMAAMLVYTLTLPQRDRVEMGAGTLSSNGIVLSDFSPMSLTHQQLEEGKVENHNKISISSISRSSITTEESARNVSLCPKESPKLVGPLYVNKSVPRMEDVEKEMSNEFNGWVSRGGRWKPTECRARVKMALIVPFRNRSEHLSIFIRHIHPMLQRQNLDYRIFVIEQLGDARFNHAILTNIGFKESLKLDQYECFIFHDVDMIPEDDRNNYGCPTSPRHMSVAIDKNNYRLPYSSSFGGASACLRKHVEFVNGFSNVYWGWGGEDDDMYLRITGKGLRVTRPDPQIGRYKMIRGEFHRSAKLIQNKFDLLRKSRQRTDYDGLNSLKYKLEAFIEHRLYTHLKANVEEARNMQ